jgi:hypothetical protein
MFKETVMKLTQSQTPIFGQLAKAQAEFSEIIKNKTVKLQTTPSGKSFGGYAYADISTVLNAITPSLNKHGLFLFQTPSIMDNQFLLTTSVANESGDILELGSVNYAIQGLSPQDLGKVITYLRRYSLLSCFGLGTEDDDALQVTKNWDKMKASTLDQSKLTSDIGSATVPKDKSKDLGSVAGPVKSETVAEIEKLKNEIKAITDVESLKAMGNKLTNATAEVINSIKPFYINRLQQLKADSSAA